MLDALGPCVVALRERRGMTQAELGAELGVEDSTISRWESGETFPRRENLKALASVLGVTEADLFRNPPALFPEKHVGPDLGPTGG
jgi:transcriptional regulator with XRE-family HTH domain